MSSLTGKRVVNTRAPHQAHELTELLEAAGAQVLHYPAIRIEPLPDPGPLDRALGKAAEGGFDWLVITSANTAYVLGRRLAVLGIGSPTLAQRGLKVAAVGPSTARAVQEMLGLSVERLPAKYVAESLAEELAVQAGARIFLPQSALARPVLAESLRAAGAKVVAVPAYRTLVGQGGDPLPEYLGEGRVDAVTFTSASTVHNFIQRLQREKGSPGMLADVVVACIGPVTAEAARRHDLPVKIVAEEHTLEGLVAGLVEHYAFRNSSQSRPN